MNGWTKIKDRILKDEIKTKRLLRETILIKSIYEELIDGQLEECELTLRDLDIISEKFTYVLSGIYHGCIGSPEDNYKGSPGKKDPLFKKKDYRIHQKDS